MALILGKTTNDRNNERDKFFKMGEMGRQEITSYNEHAWSLLHCNLLKSNLKKAECKRPSHFFQDWL